MRVAVLLLALLALPPERYEIAPGSRFSIDGTATTGSWTCEADAVRGTGTLGADGSLAAEITIPVQDFDCGFGPMNRDLRRALRAREHPSIVFELGSADVLSEGAESGTWVGVRTSGTLRLAGASRPVTLSAEGRRLPDGRVELRGHHPLRMSDFGVEPPSHALGLVRAHDSIVARFDLVAVAN